MNRSRIDVDGYLAAGPPDRAFRCTLRRAGAGVVPHTGPVLVTLDEAEARQLVRELQAALTELTPAGREDEPAHPPCQRTLPNSPP